MRNLLSGVSVAAICFGTLLLSGCAEDNEAFIRAQAEANANKDAGGAKVAAPKDQQEYHKQQQARQATAYSKSSGYPGAK